MIWQFKFLPALYLLLLLPLLMVLYIWLQRRGKSSLRYSDLPLFAKSRPAWTLRWRHLPFTLRCICLALLVVAMARPQSGHMEEEVLTEGIDIMLALDNSGSMAAEDFKPKNRLFVAKETVSRFVSGRKNDRIGLVSFAEKSYTRCPLTLDYDVLQTLLAGVHLAPRSEDGTAIGMGLATAVNRLKDSRAKSRVIVLLTDGRNNRGSIDPATGAALAEALGVKIHTIGVGTKGQAPYPVDDGMFGKRYVYLPADIDEDSLKSIAASTGGLYFRATDSRSLEEIFRRIDRMEKTQMKVKKYTRFQELFPLFLLPGALLFLTEVAVSQSRLRRLP
jgi:Ca-activated chloride channel family protein